MPTKPKRSRPAPIRKKGAVPLSVVRKAVKAVKKAAADRRAAESQSNMTAS